MNEKDIKKLLSDEAARFEQDRDVPRKARARPKAARGPSQVYAVRIPVDRLEQLRQLANKYGRPPTSLMRDWTLERLDEELDLLKRHPIGEGRIQISVLMTDADTPLHQSAEYAARLIEDHLEESGFLSRLGLAQ